MAVTAALTAAAVDNYGITVAGVEITSENCNDVLGDGTVKYESISNVLRLTDAYIIASDGIALNVTADCKPDLTIYVTGECYFRGNVGMSLSQDVDICSVVQEGYSDAYIIALGNADVSGSCGIELTKSLRTEVPIAAYGDYAGINGGWNKDLVFDMTEDAIKSMVFVGNQHAIYGPRVTFNGCSIESPEGVEQRADSHSALDFFAGDEVVTELVVNTWRHYPLYVGDVKVNDHNYGDVLGDGTVSYDHSMATLILRATELPTLAYYGTDDYDRLNITLNGDVTINGMLYFEDEAQINGRWHKLTVNNTSSDYGVATSDYLYIYNTELSVNAPFGIVGVNDAAKCKLSASDVDITSTEAAWIDVEPLLVNVNIVSPEGATYGSSVVYGNIHQAYNTDGVACTQMQFRSVQQRAYPIFVAGQQVTAENSSNITGDGTISYDHDTNTLTLDNTYLKVDVEDSEHGLLIDAPEVTINVVGNNVIEASIGLYISAENITGGGTLNIDSQEAIKFINSLTISDVDVIALGSYSGIRNAGSSDATLIINNATVEAEGASLGSMANFSELKLIHADFVDHTDAKLSFVENGFGNYWALTDADGNLITDRVCIAPSAGVNDITETQDVTIDAVYGIDGRIRPAMTSGLNIVRYSDGSVRKLIIK